jgi:hypothetical protein
MAISLENLACSAGMTVAAAEAGQARCLVQADQPGRLGGSLGQFLSDRLSGVQVTPGPDGGGYDGDPGRDGGEGEGQVQAGRERLAEGPDPQ